MQMENTCLGNHKWPLKYRQITASSQALMETLDLRQGLVFQMERNVREVQTKTIPKLNHGALQLKLSLKRRLGLLQFLLTNWKTPNMTYFTLVWWNVEGFDNYECVKSQMWKGPAISTTSHFLLCFTPFLWFILLALAVFGRGAGSGNRRGGGLCWGRGLRRCGLGGTLDTRVSCCWHGHLPHCRRKKQRDDSFNTFIQKRLRARFRL